MKPYLFPLVIGILLLPASMQAQPYEHAGGVRAGYTSGLNYKGFFLHSMNAIEVDVGYNRYGLNISGLFEFHLEPFRSSQWLAYFGGGIFGGEWEEELSLGLKAVGGIEYTLRKTPLNFGFDWRPMVNVYRSFGYDFLDFGLTVRYRFGH
ncbi:MAG: hypothetical protein GY790_14940 [Bacteroidetes bacterium]|nr:hypothetical protein [Bacteroidota bacterium]